MGLDLEDKYPQRVKNFLWHLYRNCVPTKMCLLDKGVGCPSSCVMCRVGIEYNSRVKIGAEYNSNLI